MQNFSPEMLMEEFANLKALVARHIPIGEGTVDPLSHHISELSDVLSSVKLALEENDKLLTQLMGEVSENERQLKAVMLHLGLIAGVGETEITARVAPDLHAVTIDPETVGKFLGEAYPTSDALASQNPTVAETRMDSDG